MTEPRKDIRGDVREGGTKGDDERSVVVREVDGVKVGDKALKSVAGDDFEEMVMRVCKRIVGRGSGGDRSDG